MQSLVVRILTRIRSECPRKCKELKSSLDSLLASLSSRVESGNADGEDGAAPTDADVYFDPIRAACESKQHRVMEVALEGLHQLVGEKRFLCQMFTQRQSVTQTLFFFFFSLYLSIFLL